MTSIGESLWAADGERWIDRQGRQGQYLYDRYGKLIVEENE